MASLARDLTGFHAPFRFASPFSPAAFPFNFSVFLSLELIARSDVNFWLYFWLCGGARRRCSFRPAGTVRDGPWRGVAPFRRELRLLAPFAGVRRLCHLGAFEALRPTPACCPCRFAVAAVPCPAEKLGASRPGPKRRRQRPGLTPPSSLWLHRWLHYGSSRLHCGLVDCSAEPRPLVATMGSRVASSGRSRLHFPAYF